MIKCPFCEYENNLLEALNCELCTSILPERKMKVEIEENQKSEIPMFSMPIGSVGVVVKAPSYSNYVGKIFVHTRVPGTWCVVDDFSLLIKDKNPYFEEWRVRLLPKGTVIKLTVEEGY